MRQQQQELLELKSIFPECPYKFYAGGDGNGVLIHLLALRSTSVLTSMISLHSAFLIESVKDGIAFIEFCDIQAEKTEKLNVIYNIRSIVEQAPANNLDQFHKEFLQRHKDKGIDLINSCQETWFTSYDKLEKLHDEILKDQVRTAKAIASTFEYIYNYCLTRERTLSDYFLPECKKFLEESKLKNINFDLIFGSMCTLAEYLLDPGFNPDRTRVSTVLKSLFSSQLRTLFIPCLFKIGQEEEYANRVNPESFIPYRFTGSKFFGTQRDLNAGVNCTEWHKLKLDAIGLDIDLSGKSKPSKVKKKNSSSVSCVLS